MVRQTRHSLAVIQEFVTTENKMFPWPVLKTQSRCTYSNSCTAMRRILCKLHSTLHINLLKNILPDSLLDRTNYCDPKVHVRVAFSEMDYDTRLEVDLLEHRFLAQQYAVADYSPALP